MLFKYSLKKKGRKDFIILIIRIHLLVFCLIAVLWSRRQIKKKWSPDNSVRIIERKARFLPSVEQDESAEKPKNKEAQSL